MKATLTFKHKAPLLREIALEWIGAHINYYGLPCGHSTKHGHSHGPWGQSRDDIQRYCPAALQKVMNDGWCRWTTSNGNYCEVMQAGNDLVVEVEGRRHGIPWPYWLLENNDCVWTCTSRSSAPPWVTGVKDTGLNTYQGVGVFK